MLRITYSHLLYDIFYMIELFIKEPIEFFSLRLQKRTDCCSNRYNKVCLVLDEDIENAICTNTNFGFQSEHDDNRRSDFIFWKMMEQGRFRTIIFKLYM